MTAFRRTLPYLWLSFGILWLTGGVDFLRALGANGGAAGAEFAVPVAITLILLGIVGVFAGLQLARGGARARALGLTGSVFGLLATAVALPFGLVVLIYARVLSSRHRELDLLALEFAPVLYLVTIANLTEPFRLDPLIPVRRLVLAFAATVSLSFVAPLVLSYTAKPVPPPEDQARIHERIKAAVESEDVKVLATADAWTTSFEIGSDSGDVFSYAIFRKKVRAVEVLFPKAPTFPDGRYLRQAYETGDPAILQLFASHGVKFGSPEALEAALAVSRPGPLEFALSHGATPDDALCALAKHEGHDKLVRSRVRILRKAGARTDARCHDGSTPSSRAKATGKAGSDFSFNP